MTLVDKRFQFVKGTPSRKRLNPGDIFVARMEVGCVFGRVVLPQCPVGISGHAVLIYVYRHVQREIDPWPPLLRSELMIEPQLINQLGWTSGYFATVGNEPPTPENTYPRHCIASSITKKAFDEHGVAVDTHFEPLVDRAVGNYITVNIQVEHALTKRSAIQE